VCNKGYIKTLFTPPRQTGWAWGYQSVVHFSKPMKVLCISITNLEKAALFISPCQHGENLMSIRNMHKIV
jgi:hypothetical protein